MKVSCKKLAVILSELGVERSEKSLRASCEAYGKQVFAYVGVKDMEMRRKVEWALMDRGIKPRRDYAKGMPCLEIPVSYFKAQGWDE